MLPAVWPGDILSVRSRDAAKALPGDIVLFGREGRLVAHRVVERSLRQNRIQWVTRGDTVEGNDAPVSSHQLLGGLRPSSAALAGLARISRSPAVLPPGFSAAPILPSGCCCASADFSPRLFTTEAQRKGN